MKRLIKVLVCLIALGFLGAGTASAYNVSLYVDSAPNIYGSAEWGPWWDDAKADVAGGTFTNMRSGSFPGELTADPYDLIVYSTGDLGRRLHWIYWIKGMTLETLNAPAPDGPLMFNTKMVVDWDGVNWALENGNWVEDAPDKGWVRPSLGRWENYDSNNDGTTDGVIGSFGIAYWAADDDALPLSTDGNPYNETNQADIDAIRVAVLNSQTFAKGIIGWSFSPYYEMNLEVDIKPIPEPATMLLLGSGLIGLAGFARKKLARRV